MAKKLMVVPSEVRKGGVLELGSIPVNTYSKSLKDELKSNKDITPARCLRAFRDMALIREFETMLDDIKKLGAYQGIDYKHAGPAHLSIGQEGAAVGECFHLSIDDHIFGSHRSHGEIIAKSLAAIHEVKGKTLDTIMREYFGGTILGIVEKGGKTEKPLSIGSNGKAIFRADDDEELGIDFLLYGLLSEVFGRETGFNKGMGGSMHAFFMPFGVFPNNAIVGGSADIATGAALYKKILRKKGIAVANVGDASIGCGPTWEAFGFAAMGQYSNLWDEEFRGGLPIIFNFMNNFYGMGGQPIGETMGFERLARAGAAINSENMQAECVDGNNPLSLADAYKRKIETIKNGKGPVLLEVVCYRQSGHSPSDQSSYREREEIELWKQVDPLIEFGGRLVEAGVATDDDLKAIREYTTRKIVKALTLAIDDAKSPRMVLGPHIGLEPIMFSNKIDETLPGLQFKNDVLMPLDQNPRVQQIAKKSRHGIGANGEVAQGGQGRQLPRRACSRRSCTTSTTTRASSPTAKKTATGAARSRSTAASPKRCRTTASSTRRSPKAAIAGTAVGYALEGGKPLVELMYCDFMGRAGDEVFNQMAKWQAMSGGYCHMPVVLRVSVGSKYGAQHSQDWTALCAHIPGLKVVFPATPYSAKGLMATALSGSDPVVFFESQRLYDITEHFHPGGVPAEYYRLPIGEPCDHQGRQRPHHPDLRRDALPRARRGKTL